MYEIGDLVVCCVDKPEYNKEIHIGMTGVVCHIYDGNPSVGIRWDIDRPDNINFHDCSGACEDGFGYYLHEHQIERLDQEQDDEFITAFLDIVVA